MSEQLAQKMHDLYAQTEEEGHRRSMDYFGHDDVRASVVQELWEERAPYLMAAERVRPYAQWTPTENAPLLSAATNMQVLLKREDLQPTHSFKCRGAANAVALLAPEAFARGVDTASAGNHGQGLAAVAGENATVYVPTTTPDVKIDAMRNMGAHVVVVGDSFSETEQIAVERSRAAGRTYVPPFSDIDVIHGQGTVAVEVLHDVQDADVIIVPGGGGGLAAGVGEYTKSVKPDTRVLVAQYDESNALQQAVTAGQPVRLPSVGRFSGGTSVAEVGPLNQAMVAEHTDGFILTDEAELMQAMVDLYAQTRVWYEPAGALAYAAAKKLSQQPDMAGKKVVVVCSGSNVSPEMVSDVVRLTAERNGEKALLSVGLHEQRGELRRLCAAVIGRHSVNEFRYARQNDATAAIMIGVNTAGIDDKAEFLKTLQEHGYPYVDHSANATEQALVRSMAGGPSILAPEAEAAFEVLFPERPGALLEFLEKAGDDYQISRFDYEQRASDFGRVLISYAIAGPADRRALSDALKATDYEVRPLRLNPLAALWANVAEDA